MTDQLIHKIYTFAEKIQPVYQSMNWTWYDKDIPSADQIVETLKRLIKYCSEQNCREISTGGLYVRRDNEDETQWSFGMEIYESSYFNSDL